MMTLGEYLKQTGMRQEDLASAVHVTQATVSRLARGVMSPSVELAAAIKRATQGAVDFESWVTCNHPQPAATAAQPQEHPDVPDLQSP